MIPVFDRTGRANIGHALETAIQLELERRRLDVTYVRTSDDHVVDFLAHAPDGKAELIQACADVSDPVTVGRELRALVEAGVRLPRAGKRLLTLTRSDIPVEIPRDVVVHPAYEWMLSAR